MFLVISVYETFKEFQDFTPHVDVLVLKLDTVYQPHSIPVSGKSTIARTSKESSSFRDILVALTGRKYLVEYHLSGYIYPRTA